MAENNFKAHDFENIDNDPDNSNNNDSKTSNEIVEDETENINTENNNNKDNECKDDDDDDIEFNNYVPEDDNDNNIDGVADTDNNDNYDYNLDGDEGEEETFKTILKELINLKKSEAKKRKQSQFIPSTKKYLKSSFEEKVARITPNVINNLTYLCDNTVSGKILLDISRAEKVINNLTYLCDNIVSGAMQL
jgi:hypothetical protein